MALLNRVIGGIRALLRRKEGEEELDEELRAYLDIAADQRMAAGMSRTQALRAARVEMGSVEAVKDRIRDVGWESVVETFWQDVRYALRTLRKSPRTGIIQLVLGETAGVMAVGIILGLALALCTTQLLASFLFGLTPRDPAAVAFATALLAGSAALAAYFPARHAAGVDPNVALRYE